LDSDPREALLLIERGNVLEDAGDLAGALDLYDDAVRKAPASARGHLNRGNVLMKRGDLAAAMRCYESAVEREPEYTAARYNLGNVLLRMDRFEDALKAYRLALRFDPEFADGHVAAGYALERLGRLPEAIESYRRAVAVAPLHPGYHATLAAAYARGGRHAEAARSCRESLSLAPADPSMHALMGNVLMESGDAGEAAASYANAIALDPRFAPAHANLGNACRRLGRLEDALAHYRKALAIDAGLAGARFKLATVLAELGQTDAAVTAYREASERDPDFADPLLQLGILLRNRGEMAEAIATFRAAVARDPGSAIARHNLAVTLSQSGQTREAITEFEAALRIDPSQAQTHTALGNALTDGGFPERALSSHLRAIAIDPMLAEAHNNLGNAQKELGSLDDALASYATALQADPNLAMAQANRLFVMNYAGVVDPVTILGEARRYHEILCRRGVERFSAWRCEPEPARLRVGFVSGDFRVHPVGHFLQGLLSSFDRSRLELFAYPTFERDDEIAAACRRAFTSWYPVSALDDRAAAAIIRDHGVHVLIDLSGHTAHSRLGIFTQRAAPVQATWLGYFGTTGVAEIDYIIGDRHVTPLAESRHFTERIWQMPDSYLCYAPPADLPDVAPLPARRAGHITFGCFNSFSKVSDGVIAAWSRVLDALPGSRLYLKANQLADASVRASAASRFQRAGVTPDRLRMEGFSSKRSYLEAYGEVDLALDPFPYPGGTTTVDGYLMGVPAVTRKGDRFLARNGETIACNVGLQDWIADDDRDYIARSVSWAQDIDRLGELRGTLRARALASPLCDARRFARNFEHAAWSMWVECGSARTRPAASRHN
jgi:predicted O-linked N-acetylglucosamine transferase (SPINDLY family)